jgi:hypothetical protein
MQIVGHQFGVHVEEAAEVLNAFPERAQGLIVFQIPDMVADAGVPLFGHAERVLELASTGQDMPADVLRDGERRRSIAPRAPHGIDLFAGDSCHAVVTAHVNGPIMYQEVVRDLAQPGEGNVVLIGDGLV